jgi:hypothetical protein
MAPQTFTYRGLDTSKNEIRLLRVIPGSDFIRNPPSTARSRTSLLIVVNHLMRCHMLGEKPEYLQRSSLRLVKVSSSMAPWLKWN